VAPQRLQGHGFGVITLVDIVTSAAEIVLCLKWHQVHPELSVNEAFRLAQAGQLFSLLFIIIQRYHGIISLGVGFLR
jgi:hypothetical protein